MFLLGLLGCTIGAALLPLAIVGAQDEETKVRVKT